MKIHFGLHRDGLDPTPPKTTFGEVTLGPLGLLGVLETDLGLPPVLDHPAEQLMAFRGCLEDADTPERFYHDSFSVDPINVARTLMAWRAQWFEAGWTGTFPDGVSGRLQDMADIERLAADRVPPCLGQRLHRICQALDSRRTQIEEIILCDDPDELPAAWRAVLDRLNVSVHPGVHPTPRARPDTDLHVVQHALAALATRPEGEQPERLTLKADGSFVIVKGVSRDISARAIAESLRARNASMQTIVIAEKDGIIFDNALERTGLPRCGFQHYTRFRAVSQVLKLCLALLWEPINPHLLLQFLIHPLGPVPARVRRELAGAVSSEPGIGGRAWDEAVQNLEAMVGNGEGSPDKAIAELRATIDYWFKSPRFQAGEGAPIDALAERTQRCATWLSARLAQLEEVGERAMFGAAFAQSEALLASLARLRDQGKSSIHKVELDRLLDEVTRLQPDPNTFAQTGHVRATTTPANVIDPWNSVIWWDLAAQNAELSYPWSKAELKMLRDHGVTLPTVDEQLRQRSQRWLRPLLNATDQLVLVVHHSDKGQHPLWSQLTSLFGGASEVRVDDALLTGAEAPLTFLDVPTVPLEIKPLPVPRRWWELPDDVAIPPREVESYSSLNKLFYYPHEWVLQYPARLRAGRAVELADNALLYGSLAHRLFEEFFAAHPDWQTLDAAAVTLWLDTTFPALVAGEAAVLLEPGRGVDHQRVTMTLEHALHRLLDHLKAADIVTVTSEHEETQSYREIGLRGAIDLLLTDRHGREIVVDAKWGSETYRGKQMRANQHLQLATYAYLRKAATGANVWPYPAYFIISTGNMLAPDASVFPQALVRAPQDGATVEDLWRQGELTYTWRRTQLEDAHVEVIAPETEPTARSEAPPDALETDLGPDRYDDFARLTGWGAFS